MIGKRPNFAWRNVNKRTTFIALGLIDYLEAWHYQEKLFKEIVDRKKANGKLPREQQQTTANYLLFCEHPHVYTLGKSGDQDHLLANEQLLRRKRVGFYKINRGGDITYHGPGQIVGYPILDMDHFFTDIRKYLRFLEEAVILTLDDYGVDAGRMEGLTGVWVGWEDASRARKICAFGVRSSRWVTMHGFAFNINTNLDYFNYIIPCGIRNKAVTSLQKELGRKIDMKEVENKLKKHLTEVFQMELVETQTI